MCVFSWLGLYMYYNVGAMYMVVSVCIGLGGWEYV